LVGLPAECLLTQQGLFIPFSATSIHLWLGKMISVDMLDTLWDGNVRSDQNFYVTLAKMVNEEPMLLGVLRPCGIEKGKEFKSDGSW
jgi:hypothetical protein